MKAKLQVILILFIIQLFVNPGICSEDKNINSKSPLIITLRNDMLPLSFLNVEEQPAGFIVDMWKFREALNL